MRAFYVKHLDTSSELVTEDDPKRIHHAVDVLRMKVGDKVLLIDGLGKSSLSTISKISKKKIEIKRGPIEQNEVVKRNSSVAFLKKEAMELVLRQSVELGVTNLFIVRCDRSQNYKINEKRNKQILVSALEQSNNYFLPEIKYISIDDFLKTYSKSIVVLSTEVTSNSVNTLGKRDFILIGLSGGFSEREISLFQNYDITQFKINRPIMRAETAFAFSHGLNLMVKS